MLQLEVRARERFAREEVVCSRGKQSRQDSSNSMSGIQFVSCVKIPNRATAPRLDDGSREGALGKHLRMVVTRVGARQNVPFPST